MLLFNRRVKFWSQLLAGCWKLPWVDQASLSMLQAWLLLAKVAVGSYCGYVLLLGFATGARFGLRLLLARVVLQAIRMRLDGLRLVDHYGQESSWHDGHLDHLCADSVYLFSPQAARLDAKKAWPVRVENNNGKGELVTRACVSPRNWMRREGRGEGGEEGGSAWFVAQQVWFARRPNTLLTKLYDFTIVYIQRYSDLVSYMPATRTRGYFSRQDEGLSY